MTKVWKSSACGVSTLNLAQLVALATFQQADVERRIGEPWNPATRPRPTSALREVAAELKRVNDNPGLPMDQRARLELEGDAWLCMTTMLAGHGNEETWGVIVKNLNVAMILTELGYGEELYDLLKDAMAGAFRAQIRAKRTGRWGFDGPAAATIREALQYHQVQLQAASKAHVLEALQTMHQRLADGDVYTDADAQT